MFSIQSGLKVVLCAAIVGNVALAAEQSTSTSAKSFTVIVDLSLTSTGHMVGRYIDGEGRGIDGAIAVISQGRQVVAQTATDREGAYQFPGVKSGVYRLTVGKDAHVVRVWPMDLAPSAARPLLTTVRSDQVIRGQFGGGPVDLGLLVGAAGLAVGTVGYLEAKDANDDLDALRQQMAALSGGGAPMSP